MISLPRVELRTFYGGSSSSRQPTGSSRSKLSATSRIKHVPFVANLIFLVLISKFCSSFARILHADVIPADDYSQRPRRVVLMGPHDRFNFGDLLFEKVVSRLLIGRRGYRDEDLIRAGMVSVDMSDSDNGLSHGGAKVLGLPEVVEMSKQATVNGNGPFNVVFLGGEIMGCSYHCGASMLSTPEMRNSATAAWEMWEQETGGNDACAYIFPKSWLLPPNHSSSRLPVAIINSAGGSMVTANGSPCRKAVESSDFVSFRDLQRPGNALDVWPPTGCNKLSRAAASHLIALAI